MKQYRLIVTAVLFVLTGMLAMPHDAAAQGDGILVSGVVRDASSQPLPGASVQIKGTLSGTVTDLDGQYSINVHKRDVLVFSFIGMIPQEIIVEENTRIDVSLKDDTTLLEEAVSIGYSTQSKSLVTNAIQKVGEKEFLQTPSQNALVQLQGKVPGLSIQVNSGQPGAAPQIFLRGGTTNSPESDTPLIIIDGVITNGTRGIQDMNPADIESMEVLKDAASTAIYGARAANGIIIVKTKSGSSGKPKISFKYTFALDQQPRKLDLLNAKEYVYLMRNNTAKFNTTNPATFLEGDWGMSTGHNYYSSNTLDFLDNYITTYGAGFVENLINKEGWQTMEDPVTGKMLLFQDNDMQAATFQLAPKHEFNFNISGGDDKSTYYSGIRYLNQEGILRGTNYDNFGLIYNNTRKLSKSWSLETKATLNYSKSNSVSDTEASLTRAILMPPTYRLYYPDGTPAEGEGMNTFQPRLHEIYYRDRYTTVINTLATFQAGAVWNIIPGLTFRPTVYYTLTHSNSNKFEALNETTGTEIRPASAVRNHTDHVQADVVLNYSKDIKKNNINATLGTSYNFDRVDNMNASGSGAPSDLIPTINATADTTQRASNTIEREAMLSAFGRINYAFDGKYLVSASIRADGSSKFSEKHRWGFFPGASLGWNMHKENFFSAIRSIVNKVKFRASWGMAGNNNLSLANSQGLYGITSTTYMGEVGILNSTLKNADLVWETTESFDAGIDLGFLDDRIGLIVDVYSKYTYNRLYDMNLWSSTGYSSIKYNYGTFRSRGIEIQVNTTPIATRDLTWNLDFNFTYYNTVALKLPETEEDKNRTGGNYIYDPDSDSVIKVGGLAEGERFGTRYAWHYLGVYQTDEEAATAPYDEAASGRTKYAGDAIYEDRNGDGVLNNLDFVFMGYIRPNITGGITSTLTWRGLSMRLVMDYAVGHVICNTWRGMMLGSFRNNCNTLREALTDTWQYAGDGSSLPKYTVQSDADYNYRNYLRSAYSIGNSGSGSINSSHMYKKGDYLAFRELSLSYSLPERYFKKIFIKGVQFNAGVYNIGYITGYDGLTPEIFTGRDYGSYPRPREYSFSINLTF